jgi:predicted ATPase
MANVGRCSIWPRSQQHRLWRWYNGTRMVQCRRMMATFSNNDEHWSSGPLHDLYDSLVHVVVGGSSPTTTTFGPTTTVSHHTASLSSLSSLSSSSSSSSAPIRRDAIQLQALRALERLRHNLSTYPPPTTTTTTSSSSSNNNNNTLATSRSSNSSSRLSGWFNSHSWMEPPSNTSLHQQQHHHHPPLIRGAYLHGGVGCGKTFLMNRLFYESFDHRDTIHNSNLEAWKTERQQVHFYKFMARVHQEMHRARQASVVTNNTSSAGNGTVTVAAKAAASDDLWPSVIANIAQQGRLILLDEFQVTDVADALLLQRLFTGLWDDHGCVVVATSNRPPHDLYKGWLATRSLRTLY